MAGDRRLDIVAMALERRRFKREADASDWRTWLKTSVQREPGRVGAVIVGVATEAAAITLLVLNELNAAVGGTLAVGGLLIGGGALAAGVLEEIWLAQNVGAKFRRTDEDDRIALLEEEVRAARQLTDEEGVAELDLPGDADDGVGVGARYAVGEDALMALLDAPGGALEGYELRLFMPSALTGKLHAILRPDGAEEPSVAWAVGQGVTGQAWEELAYTFATGDECHDGTFGLDVEMQRRYADTTGVAATPLFDSDDVPLAVLAASTKQPAPQLDEDTPAFWQIIATAEKAARLLEELLGFEN